MLRGVATTNYWAEDLAAAKAWYTEVLGLEPYYDTPAYVEWRLGDHSAELGIIDGKYHRGGMPDRPGGVIAHWAVDDVQASLDRLLALGATPFEPLTERGPGFVTASVVDPFGNVLGIMHNVHYLEHVG